MTGVKGNKRRVIQYKNEYGLMFLFCDRAFKQISEDFDLHITTVKRFAEIFYIQKYIIGTNVVNMQELVRVSDKLEMGYTYNTVRNMILKMHEMGLADNLANHYHLNVKTQHFIKRFDYWFHFHTVNFHGVATNGKTLLTQSRRAKKKLELSKKRKKRTKKT
jgi:hypothetical protein